MSPCLVDAEKEWAAIIILLYVSGSAAVSVRGRLRLLALWGASS